MVSYYSADFSHFLAHSSLGTWLKDNGIPAIYGVDTRALTKKIREKGSMLARLLARVPGIPRGRSRSIVSRSQTTSRAPSPGVTLSWREDYVDIPFRDPNQDNLVAAVSIAAPPLYEPTTANCLRHPSGRPLRVLAIDVGMKYNQIRCFIQRGVELRVVPWDYDFLSEPEPYDGLFISNGPGDPTMVKVTITRLEYASVTNCWPWQQAPAPRR